MRIWIAIGVVAFGVCAPAEVAAQVTVGAALGQSVQSAGASDNPHLEPGFGGTSLAGVGMIDVAIRPRVSIGGEISLAGDISGAQRQRVIGGDNALLSDHHDTIFSGVVKFGTRVDRWVRAMAVIGAGIAQRHTERTATFQPFVPPPPKQPPTLEILSDTVVALTAGADVSIGINEHLALLGIGRLYLLADSDRVGGDVYRGVSSTIFRVGGGVQIRF